MLYEVITIGDQTAERLKIEIGNASPDKTIEKVEIKGTDAITGLPRRLDRITSYNVCYTKLLRTEKMHIDAEFARLKDVAE